MSHSENNKVDALMARLKVAHRVQPNSLSGQSYIALGEAIVAINKQHKFLIELVGQRNFANQVVGELAAALKAGEPYSERLQKSVEAVHAQQKVDDKTNDNEPMN